MKSKLLNLDPASLASNPRATLRSWLKYEAIVKAAIALHPRPYVSCPPGLSPNTVGTRLRDAIRGKLAFNFPSTLSNETISNWYGEIIIKYDDKQLYIGPPQVVTELLAGTSTSQDSQSYDAPSFEAVSALQLLLSTAMLRGPITITNPPDCTLLPDRPNVVLIPREDGSLILY